MLRYSPRPLEERAEVSRERLLYLSSGRVPVRARTGCGSQEKIRDSISTTACLTRAGATVPPAPLPEVSPAQQRVAAHLQLKVCLRSLKRPSRFEGTFTFDG